MWEATSLKGSAQLTEESHHEVKLQNLLVQSPRVAAQNLSSRGSHHLAML